MRTVSALRDRYLEWIERHRSSALYREAKRHLKRWCDPVGETDATSIIGADLEAFQESLIADALANNLDHDKRFDMMIRCAEFGR